MTEQEINETVARKLGWTYISEPEIANPWKHPSGLMWHKPYDYSRAIVPALEIIEFVERLGLAWRIQRQTYRDMKDPYECDMERRINGHIRDQGSSAGYGQTLPMAICRAFLALEVL